MKKLSIALFAIALAAHATDQTNITLEQANKLALQRIERLVFTVEFTYGFVVTASRLTFGLCKRLAQYTASGTNAFVDFLQKPPAAQPYTGFPARH